jgi:hypothetical protein
MRVPSPALHSCMHFDKLAQFDSPQASERQ